VGQAVKAGQVLVSGYLDCGSVTKAIHADAEIKALTFHDLEVISPRASIVKGIEQEVKTRYALRIGKNLIKFYKDSGNLDTTCGKIYLEEYVHLPGGFQLPVSLIKERLLVCDEDATCSDSSCGDWIAQSAKSYLQTEMLAGQVLSEETQENNCDDMYYFYGKYVCIEMIGQVRYEQTILKDEQYD
jgi:hypothetical protein